LVIKIHTIYPSLPPTLHMDGIDYSFQFLKDLHSNLAMQVMGINKINQSFTA